MSPSTNTFTSPALHLLRRSLHEEVLAQQWSQSEIAAFYHSRLPDLIVEIAGATLHKLGALPHADLCHSLSVGAPDEQGTL